MVTGKQFVKRVDTRGVVTYDTWSRGIYEPNRMSSNELVIKIMIVRSEAMRLPMLLYTGRPILFGMPVFTSTN